MLQYSVPSFHSTPQTISDGTDHLEPATLRGLGPDQLLVLINGKRRHSSSLVNINGTVGRGTVATDLNAIPASAIDRIEVLKDGAAAEYGSDAIAGIINIILKENTNVVDINVQSGITQKGDGAVIEIDGNYGFTLGEKGMVNLTAAFNKRGHINRSGDYTGMVFGDERDENPDALAAFFQQTGYKGQRVMSIGSAATSNASLFINADLPLNQKIAFYVFGGISYRFGESMGFYRFPYQKTRQFRYLSFWLFSLNFIPIFLTMPGRLVLNE